jgi:hypothetical protein
MTILRHEGLVSSDKIPRNKFVGYRNLLPEKKHKYKKDFINALKHTKKFYSGGRTPC